MVAVCSRSPLRRRKRGRKREEYGDGGQLATARAYFNQVESKRVGVWTSYRVREVGGKRNGACENLKWVARMIASDTAEDDCGRCGNYSISGSFWLFSTLDGS